MDPLHGERKCATCKWWGFNQYFERYEGGDTGNHGAVFLGGARLCDKMPIDQDGGGDGPCALGTPADFGCILHEPKDVGD